MGCRLPHVNILSGGSVPLECIQTAVEQQLGHKVVETGDDNPISHTVAGYQIALELVGLGSSHRSRSSLRQTLPACVSKLCGWRKLVVH